MMQRWDPVAEIRRLENRINRIWGKEPSNDDFEAWSIPLDVREEGDAVVVKASVPGMDPQSIDVTIEGGVLTIKGETKSEKEEEKEGYLLKERREGSFYRSVRLPDSIDASKATSPYDNGVLSISMPKLAEKKAAKIKIDVK